MASDSSVKLHLKSDWQFYLIVVTGGPRRSYQVEQLVKVGRVDTFLRNVVHFEQEAPLSQFKLVNNKRPSFALFRDPISPAWEDEHNKDGGGFNFEIPQNEESRPFVDETWRNLQFSAVSSNGLDSLPALEPRPGDDRTDARSTDPVVNGVIVTLKSDKSNTKFFFEVWVARCQIEASRREHIIGKIRECIKLPPGWPTPNVKFAKHRISK
jgi:hypothetical protein